MPAGDLNEHAERIPRKLLLSVCFPAKTDTEHRRCRARRLSGSDGNDAVKLFLWGAALR